MAYEFFKRTSVRQSAEPRLSISSVTGRLSFNASATRLLQSKNVEAFMLGFDKEKKQIALKQASKSDDGCYVLRFAKKGKGSGFQAKPFLAWIGHKSGSLFLPCKWVERQNLFEAPLAAHVPRQSKNGS